MTTPRKNTSLKFSIPKDFFDTVNKRVENEPEIENEAQLKIACYIKDNRIIIDFGKELSWLGFDKNTLRNFIDGLENTYKEL